MRAAVIGLGHQGKRIVGALRSLPDVELVAAVDLSENALAWPDLGNSVFTTTDPQACFDLGTIDLACITTLGPSHADLVVAAFEAGISRVMVEKPMACSVSECLHMMAAADRLGGRLAVNQSRRHDPCYRWLRDEIRSGRLGEPRAFWIQRPGIGLGCLGTHYFDLVRFLSGREVRRVTAFLDKFIGPNPRGEQYVNPGGLVVLELDGPMRAVISQIEDGAGPMSVEIDTTAARIQIDERFDRIEVVRRDVSVKPGPDRPVLYQVHGAPAGLSAKTNVTNMARGVLEELVSSEPMICDARHGLASIEVLAAAHLSARRGNAPVELPLSPEGQDLWLSVT